MESIAIKPMGYFLKLEHDCWYCGITYNLNMRIAQHIESKGAYWTKIHKVIKIKKVFYPASLELERQMTLKYMRKYGWNKVRGGPWCQYNLVKPAELDESAIKMEESIQDY